MLNFRALSLALYATMLAASSAAFAARAPSGAAMAIDRSTPATALRLGSAQPQVPALTQGDLHGGRHLESRSGCATDCKVREAQPAIPSEGLLVAPSGCGGSCLHETGPVIPPEGILVAPSGCGGRCLHETGPVIPPEGILVAPNCPSGCRTQREPDAALDGLLVAPTCPSCIRSGEPEPAAEERLVVSHWLRPREAA